MVYLTERARKLRRKLTPEEKLLWKKLRNKKLFTCNFRRQHPVGRYIPDFYSRKAKLVVEVDGRHHASEEVLKYDRERTRYLEERGLLVIRFWNSEVRKNFGGVLETILRISELRMK